MDYQQVLAECYVTMIEVDWELKQWRKELDDFVYEVVA